MGRAQTFQDELKQVLADYPSFRFCYPSLQEMTDISRINYITSDQQTRQRLIAKTEKLDDALADDDLENLKYLLTEDTKRKLRKLLSDEENS